MRSSRLFQFTRVTQRVYSYLLKQELNISNRKYWSNLEIFRYMLIDQHSTILIRIFMI